MLSMSTPLPTAQTRPTTQYPHPAIDLVARYFRCAIKERGTFAGRAIESTENPTQQLSNPHTRILLAAVQISYVHNDTNRTKGRGDWKLDDGMEVWKGACGECTIPGIASCAHHWVVETDGDR